MAVTVLCDVEITGVNGACSLIVDYDDVAQTIGATVTGTGNPVVQALSAGGKAIGKAQPLAAFLGAGRQVLLRSVASTSVLPLDADRVPTKVTLTITWAA